MDIDSNLKHKLAYAKPGVALASDPRLRGAMICGAIPLGTGVSATVGAVLTHHIIFGIIGLITLGFGLVFFLLGLLDLIGFVNERRRKFGRLDRNERLRAGLVILLLFSNFPAAAICLSVGGKALSLGVHGF